MTGNLNGESKIDVFCRDETLAIQNGFACGDWNDEGKGILQIRPFNITNFGQIDLRATKYVETDRNVEAYVLQNRDVIFNNTNSEELVGKVAVWSRNQRAVLSNHMTILRVLRQDMLSPEFLSFYLLKRWFDGYFHSVCRRHVNQASVSIERLRETDFPDFDFSEQRKIAAVLGLVQRAIEQQERLIALTTELKKALLHKLFSEGLRGEPQKQTEIGPVPESWEIVRLGEICALGTGTTPPTARPEYYNGDVPFVKTADIANNRIKISQTNVSHAAVKDCGLKLYPPGTVLMAMYGQGKTRGQVALLEISAATSQNAAAIQTSEEINAEFLWQYLMSRYQVLRSSGALGHISHLNLGYVRDFQIPKPPIVIQHEIAEILRTIDSRLTVIESRKLLLTDLFRTLLHQLMTAQIRVDNLDLPKLLALKN